MSRPKKSTRNLPNPDDNNLRRLRRQAYVSQEKLAREIGVAVSTIRRWEKGQQEPTFTIAQVRQLCQALGRDFWDLPPVLADNKKS